jgi:hypothetical protein
MCTEVGATASSNSGLNTRGIHAWPHKQGPVRAITTLYCWIGVSGEAFLDKPYVDRSQPSTTELGIRGKASWGSPDG